MGIIRQFSIFNFQTKGEAGRPFFVSKNLILNYNIIMFSKKDFQPIIKYLKPYKKAVRVVVAFLILEHATYLVLPLIYGKIVESGDHVELLQHGGVYQKLSELQKISV